MVKPFDSMIEPMEPKQIVNEMAQHTKEYPTHGLNCTCKDYWIRQFREWRKSLTDAQRRELLYLVSSYRSEDD